MENKTKYKIRPPTQKKDTQVDKNRDIDTNTKPHIVPTNIKPEHRKREERRGRKIYFALAEYK